MIYNKLEGTTSQSFSIGKNGVSIANENGQLKVIVPVVGGNDFYEFIIGVDELEVDSKDIPSAEAIIAYIQETIGSVLEGNYLDLSLEDEQRVAGPVVFEQDITVQGNINIEGNINQVDVENLVVKDKTITVASGALSILEANGAGIIINGAEASLTYSSSTNSMVLNKQLDITGNVKANQLILSEVEGPPLIVQSTVMVENLNAQYLGGKTLSILESELVPRDLSVLEVKQFQSSIDPASSGPIYMFGDNGSDTGIKISIEDVVRPSVFLEEQQNKAKIGDFIYTEITQ